MVYHMHSWKFSGFAGEIKICLRQSSHHVLGNVSRISNKSWRLLSPLRFVCLPYLQVGFQHSVHQPPSQRMWQLLYTEAILASKEAVLLVCFWSTFWQLEKGETSSMGLVSFLLTSAKHQTLPGSLAWVTSSQGQTWAWVSGEGREGSGPTVTLLPTSPTEPCP